MKVPKTTRRLCPKCKKHTEQKVSLAKRKGLNATHHITRGSRRRQLLRHRGVGIGMGNRGKFSKPPVMKRKMTGKKLTKKTDFRYTCTVCKKTSVSQHSLRLKKVEFQ